MSIIKLNENNFSIARESTSPVLIDFYADWCGPCRMVAPVVEQIAEERSDVIVGKVNVDESPALAAEFGVYSIPTLVVMKGGRVVRREVGAKPKGVILSMIEG